MSVTFTEIKVGLSYSRNELADLWGYSGYQALARGVVTPKEDNKIILFVTAKKQISSEQYQDELDGNRLKWEGPNDHFAEDRIIHAVANGDEIHLFYRERHHTDFVYFGQLDLLEYELSLDRPSKFIFKINKSKDYK